MSKLKTHSGMQKRVKKTAHGYKHKKAGTQHILTKKSPKRKRQLRGTKYFAPSDTAQVKDLLND